MQGCSQCPVNTFNNRAVDVRCFACCSLSLSDGTSCSEFPVVPAGYQHTASGNNLESCPVNTYNNGSDLVCTPANVYATLEANVALKTGVSDWRLVRFLNTGATSNHAATDYLQGTDEYVNSWGWSKKFGEFDQLFIANGATTHWIFFNRDIINPVFFCWPCHLRWLRSSKHPTSSSTANVYMGHSSMYLSTGNWEDQMVYLDASHSFRPNIGSQVYVRSTIKTPIAIIQCQTCPKPSTYTVRGRLTSVAECECAAGYSRNANGVCAACAVGSFEPVNGVCQACTPPTAKLNPGNEACIGCGPNSALDPDKGHNNQTSCKCLAGYTGDWRGCDACLHGFYKSDARAGQCSACAARATTAQNASTSIADCFCAPPELWEPGPSGSNIINGSCVALCAAGTTGSAGVCVLCAAGKFKPATGNALCTACTAPSQTQTRVPSSQASARVPRVSWITRALSTCT